MFGSNAIGVVRLRFLRLLRRLAMAAKSAIRPSLAAFTHLLQLRLLLGIQGLESGDHLRRSLEYRVLAGVRIHHAGVHVNLAALHQPGIDTLAYRANE